MERSAGLWRDLAVLASTVFVFLIGLANLS